VQVGACRSGKGYDVSDSRLVAHDGIHLALDENDEVVGMDMGLLRVTKAKYQTLAWTPFALCVLLFFLLLSGLAYSMFPFVILDNMTIWDAASAVGSLKLILLITFVAVPIMVLFNLMGYRSLFGRAP